MSKLFIYVFLFSSLPFGLWFSGEPAFRPGRLAVPTAMMAGDTIFDPVPDAIQKSGLEIRLYPLVTIPASSFSTDRTRINLLKQMPGPSGNLMINDLRGKLSRIDTSRQVHLYLDLKARTNLFIDAPGKGTGFGAFAFHPEFESNGVFFTVHTESNNGTPDFVPKMDNGIAMHWVLTKWTATDPSAGSFAGTREEMIRFAYPGIIHGLQDLTFNPLAKSGDPDYGMLYLCVGEGQSSLQGLGAANLLQSDSYLGSIFRIDPMGNNSANGKYGIPADNPFVGKQTVGQEIWAYGFRNPHRLCFDPRNNSKGYALFACDIGEKNVEEINLIEAGKNYGWNVREGIFVYDWHDREHVLALPADDSGFVYPVAMYDHDEGLAVVSGYVFRNNQQPDLQGQLLLGDIVSGRLFHLPADSLVWGRQYPVQELEVFLENASSPTSLLSEVNRSRADVRFGYDLRGNMYVTTKGDGKVYSVGPYQNPVAGLSTAVLAASARDFEFKLREESLEITGARVGSHYQLVALDGRVVAQGMIRDLNGESIHIAGLSKGVYVISMEYKGAKSQAKFVK